MKPPKFDYAAPATIPAALALLAQSEDAKILAGGQSLVPLLNMRLAMPELLVDINRLQDAEPLVIDGSLSAGPLVRQSELECALRNSSLFPLLREAIGWVGHPQIRNRGTVLGSIAHADPAAELPVAFLALDGQMTMTGPNGNRSVKADQFFFHVMETAIGPDEMLTSASAPRQPAGSGSAFLEVARRHGDFAVASVAVVLRVERNEITGARVSLGGVAPIPKRARDLEIWLAGQTAAPAFCAEAGRRAVAETEAASDIHGTAEYRRDIIRALVERALTLALERAAGSADQAEVRLDG